MIPTRISYDLFLSGVTCDPLINVSRASPLYNGMPPTYSQPLYMDFVTFKCDPGFQQTSGSATDALRRVCSLDGSWVLHPDHQEPLVCDSKSSPCRMCAQCVW